MVNILPAAVCIFSFQEFREASDMMIDMPVQQFQLWFLSQRRATLRSLSDTDGYDICSTSNVTEAPAIYIHIPDYHCIIYRTAAGLLSLSILV